MAEMANGDGGWACRGIRGATTAATNTAEDILEATRELVVTLVYLNDLRAEDVVSAIFTTTPDLTATFPALAAREVGWTEVPLLCAHEMSVPGALPRVVRVLLHVNTPRSAAAIRHVYLKETVRLRPEWTVSEAEQARALAAANGRGAALPVAGE